MGIQTSFVFVIFFVLTWWIVSEFENLFCRFEGALLEEGALSIAVQGESLTPDFMALCVWLSENLKFLCSMLEHVTGKKLKIFNVGKNDRVGLLNRLLILNKKCHILVHCRYTCIVN